MASPCYFAYGNVAEYAYGLTFSMHFGKNTRCPRRPLALCFFESPSYDLAVLKLHINILDIGPHNRSVPDFFLISGHLTQK